MSVQMPNTVKADDLVKEFTSDYMPAGYAGLFYLGRNRPPFTHWTVREMLQDPRVRFGLSLIKGPIASMAKFQIQGENTEANEYVAKQVNRFWKNSLMRALRAIEWGYSGSEVVYRFMGGQLHFDRLKDIDPLDVRPVIKEGELTGINVRNVHWMKPSARGTIPLYLGIPKAFWHIHNREFHAWFGQSRLYSAHIPWHEIWSDGGYRDVRRLWFYKNSFDGGTLYHPPGITRLPNGQAISNKDLAREIVEKKRTGGVMALPTVATGDRNRAWEYEPAKANPAPGDLMEYGHDLRKEILEALGIPPEVIESESSEGFGSSSGRQIPALAFFSTLQELVQWLIYDLDNQVLRFLVGVNFGPVEYEILAKPLVEAMSEAMNPKDEGGTGGEFPHREPKGPPDEESSGKKEEPENTETEPGNREIPDVASAA